MLANVLNDQPNSSLRVAGVDYGKRRIAIVAPGVAVDMLRLPQSTPASEALFLCGNFLRNFIFQHGISSTWVESPIMGMSRNAQTMASMSMMAGVLLYACEAGESKSTLIAPSTWKKEVIGRGNATKDDAALWLKANSPQSFALCMVNGRLDQDLVDATCIAVAGLMGEADEARAAKGDQGGA